MSQAPRYANEGYDILVATAEVRVTEITVAAGQPVPAHKHSHAQELCYCVAGELTVEIAGHPPTALHPGQRCIIAVEVVHRLINRGTEPCKFLLIHCGGAFDFITSRD